MGALAYSRYIMTIQLKVFNLEEAYAVALRRARQQHYDATNRWSTRIEVELTAHKLVALGTIEDCNYYEFYYTAVCA